MADTYNITVNGKAGKTFSNLANSSAKLGAADGMLVHRNSALEQITGREVADGILDIFNTDFQILKRFNDGLYGGRDLETVFASEIANFSDPWKWMQDRINNENTDGLLNGDYLKITMTDNEVFLMQINIAPYENSGDTEIPFHIDFISKDCGVDTVQWNTTNNNNGNSTNDAPWMVSNIYTWLNNTLYGRLPSNVQAMITNKRTLIETRYSSSGTLTDSSGWAWNDIGKLWVPTETEIFGTVVWGTKGWSAGQGIRYPVFHNFKDIKKGAGNGGARCDWWGLSVRSGDSAYACLVGGYGFPGHWAASGAIHVPLCFRICKKANA